MDYCLMMELKRKATAARTHNGTYGRNADELEDVPFPVSWTVKMKKKQKETQDILSYHTRQKHRVQNRHRLPQSPHARPQQCYPSPFSPA